MKAWLDDFGLHSQSEQGLLDSLEKFFRICRERRLKISAKKSVLFSLRIKRCGRLIDKDGVQCDPSHLSGLKDAQMQQTAAELSQFIYRLEWMSGSILGYATRMAPLKKVLEEAYERPENAQQSLSRIYDSFSCPGGPYTLMLFRLARTAALCREAVSYGSKQGVVTLHRCI